MTVIKGLGHIYQVHLELAWRRFKYAGQHPYRSMFGSLIRSLVTLWTFLVSFGLLTGTVHLVIHH